MAVIIKLGQSMCKNKDKEEKANDLYQDALESWAEYQETGEYVTWDEAKACLQAWGAEDNEEQPR